MNRWFVITLIIAIILAMVIVFIIGYGVGVYEISSFYTHR